MKDITYIILVNYNGINDTKKCIESIRKNEKNLNYKIVVVDNASTDDSVEKLKDIEDIIFLESRENLGFAKGNNLAIKYALEQNAKCVILLNNDTEIEENALGLLYNVAYEHPEVGVMGSRIMYYDDKELINYCGGHINWLKAIPVHENEKQKYSGNNFDFKYTEFITGCCMLIKREVLEKVGMLPEEYFMYYEDTDYCVNILNNGYKLGVNENSVIYHKVSASSGGAENPFAFKWCSRNRLIFMNKYKKQTKGIFTYLYYYLTSIIHVIQYDEKKSKAILEGMKMGRAYLNDKKSNKLKK